MLQLHVSWDAGSEECFLTRCESLLVNFPARWLENWLVDSIFLNLNFFKFKILLIFDTRGCSIKKHCEIRSLEVLLIIGANPYLEAEIINHTNAFRVGTMALKKYTEETNLTIQLLMEQLGCKLSLTIIVLVLQLNMTDANSTVCILQIQHRKFQEIFKKFFFSGNFVEPFPEDC